MREINLDNYKIILERKQLKLWLSGNSFRYMCFFHICTSIGTYLFDITCTEGDIVKLLETFYEYIATSSHESEVYLNNSNIINMNGYGFELDLIPESGGNSSILSIVEYNPISDLFFKRVSINLIDGIYTIEDLLIDIYEEFLSDIPDLTYINPDFLR